MRTVCVLVGERKAIVSGLQERINLRREIPLPHYVNGSTPRIISQSLVEFHNHDERTYAFDVIVDTERDFCLGDTVYRVENGELICRASVASASVA